MNERRLLLLALAGLALAACSSSGSTTDAALGNDGPMAACVSGKLTLAGDLDGQPVDAQLDSTGRLFQQVNLPYTSDFTYAAGSLHLEWNAQVIADAHAIAATGTVVIPAGPHAGETICAGSGTIRGTDPAGTGFAINQIFTLATLSSGPTCPGAALAGSIAGCIGE